MDGVGAAGVDVAAPVFGRYRIHELLGRGGMGTVHRAYDVEHRRMVALKRLPETEVDERFRARFRREARLAAGLVHPHAVPVHDFGEIDGQLFLDMMLVEGSDLRRLLGSGLLDPGRGRWRCSARSPSALDAAHAAGLVHRDVKPSNILIDPDDHAYLADFGIAFPMSPDATGLTGSGPVLGTLGLPGPRAALRWAGGRAGRPVLAGLRAVRVPHRPPAPPGRTSRPPWWPGTCWRRRPPRRVFAATVSPGARRARAARAWPRTRPAASRRCAALIAAAEAAVRGRPARRRRPPETLAAASIPVRTG